MLDGIYFIDVRDRDNCTEITVAVKVPPKKLLDIELRLRKAVLAAGPSESLQSTIGYVLRHFGIEGQIIYPDYTIEL